MSEKAIEAAARARYEAIGIGPWYDLCQEDKDALLGNMRHTIAAYEAAMWREPVAWRYRSEAPGGKCVWSVTQFRDDLDALSKMPFMRVEPLYALPTVPEGE